MEISQKILLKYGVFSYLSSGNLFYIFKFMFKFEFKFKYNHRFFLNRVGEKVFARDPFKTQLRIFCLCETI